MLIGILAWTSLEKRGRLCCRQDSQKKRRDQIEELIKYSCLWEKELGWAQDRKASSCVRHICPFQHYLQKS